jgi:predicted permease
MNWKALFRRKRLEEDLDDEIRLHVSIEVQQRIERGESKQTASRNAYKDFGNVELVKETTRDTWGGRWIDDIRRDLKYAIRSLRKAPSFTLIVLATLALAIGANAAVFSVVNAVLLRPLKVSDATGLIQFSTTVGTATSALAFAQDFDVWRQQTAIFEDVSAHRLEFASLASESGAEQVPIGRVSAEFFRLFRAPVLYGRTFTTAEDTANAGAFAVLSYGIWVRRYGSDPGIVGRVISLGGAPHVVVGILSPDFETEQFDVTPEIWVPFQIDPNKVDGGNSLIVSARLKPGVTPQMANAQLAVLSVLRQEQSPNRPRVRTFSTVQLLRDAMVGEFRTSLNLLLAMAGLVLLIACGNIANLQLVRADVRKREIAIRTAIGANRARIARQLFTETFILWMTGGALGLLLGIVSMRSLLAIYPGNNPFKLVNGLTIPRIGENGSAVTLDWRVLTFALLVTAITGLVFGLLPSLRAFRTDPYATLKQVSSTSATGRDVKARSVLVVMEIALALMLLVGATLLIRTSMALARVRPGFDSKHVLTMRMPVTGTRFERRDGIGELTLRGIERIRGIAGVIAASTACCMPLETVWQAPFIVQGRPLTGRWHAFAGWTFVSPGYFDVFKIPILRGRDFTEHDDASAPGAVIINEAMARKFWPDSDPLNDNLLIGRGLRPEYDDDPVRQIVGIVGNVRDTALNRDPRPAMYVPVAQLPDGVTMLDVRLLPVVWIMRTEGQPYSISAQIQKELQQVSGGLPLARIRSMDEVVTESTALTRFNTRLLGVFAGLAVLLAIVGVYGLLAYSVEQRGHEIGIRLALGATSRRVGNMVILQGTVLAGAGLIIGTIAALSFSHLLASFLFEVKPRDPFVFVTAPIVLTLAALIAVWVPARRASRIDPATLLRYE